MFLGHFALAIAAKKFAPKASLGLLVLSAQFADCLWPVLLLLGFEQVRIVPGITRVTPLDFVSYPILHSLLMQLVWGSPAGRSIFSPATPFLHRDNRWGVAADALAAGLFCPPPGPAALSRRAKSRAGDVEFPSPDIDR